MARDLEQWDVEETAVLLEAIERAARVESAEGEESERWREIDWEEIADQVGGGRSARDCLLHFLRLPIEQSALRSEWLADNVTMEGAQGDSSMAQSESVPNSGETAPDAEKYSELGIFMAMPNPVLALILYLQQTLSIDVAAAAAQGAMRSFAVSHDEWTLGAERGELKEENFPDDAAVARAMSSALRCAGEQARYNAKVLPSSLYSSLNSSTLHISLLAFLFSLFPYSPFLSSSITFILSFFSSLLFSSSQSLVPTSF